jgi:hypothetical protein
MLFAETEDFVKEALLSRSEENVALLSNCTSAAICPNPVFIIGAPRSGTSILAWSLAQHSQFWTSGESYFVFDLFGQNAKAKAAYDRAAFISSEGWLQRESVSLSEYLAYLGLGANALFTSRSGGKRWVDHTPHHALIAETLAHMFPGAYFLHILRDGRKVVSSMQKFQDRLVGNRKASEIESSFVPAWANDFRKACQTWRDYVEASMKLATQMPERCLTVKLDDLSLDPQAGFARISGFLNTSYETAVTTYFQSNRLNSSFVKESRPADPWRGWDAEQHKMFVAEAGATMIKYGFVNEADLYADRESALSLSRVQLLNLADAKVPSSATVAVISKGDSRLLNLPGRRAWHFPQDESGSYAGHHPADSEEAIAHLESLRARGLDYLLIPETSLWWLDHYTGFREHLDARYRRLPTEPICAIYQLLARDGTDASVAGAVAAPRAKCETKTA